jgi:hypothetical protein
VQFFEHLPTITYTFIQGGIERVFGPKVAEPLGEVTQVERAVDVQSRDQKFMVVKERRQKQRRKKERRKMKARLKKEETIFFSLSMGMLVVGLAMMLVGFHR